MEVGLHTASLTDTSECASVLTCVCAFLHTFLSASVLIIRLRKYCGGGICVDVCARGFVCVDGGGGKHHCGRQADGDGNE